MSQKKSDQKPQLHLIPGNKIDAEILAKLFQSLTDTYPIVPAHFPKINYIRR